MGTKYSNSVKLGLATLVARGYTLKASAAALGIPVITVYKWLQQGREGHKSYASLVQALEESRELAIRKAIDIVQGAYHKDWHSAAWFLEHNPYSRETYRKANRILKEDSRIEVTINDKRLDHVSDSELEGIVAEYRELPPVGQD